MNCERFDEELVDLARGEEGDGDGRDAALAHAEGCVRCAARLEDERAVTSALRAFATRTAGAEAPPRVEAALLRALRQPEESGAKAGPSRAIGLLLLAAAAAILAAIVVVPPQFERQGEPGATAFPAGSPTLRAGAAEPDEHAEFVALRYGEDLRDLDSLQLVSVELPPTALAALGWPAGDSGSADWVRAEVIVGHDGVARAIRFVE
jgi:hypothetical protein